MRFASTLRLLSLSVLATAACESNTEPGVPERFVATWAGESVQGPAQAYQDGTQLWILGQLGQERSVHIHITDYTGPGTYSLDADEAEVQYMLGGDVTVASYTTAAAGAGTLVVSEGLDGGISGTVQFDAESREYVSKPVGDRARLVGEFEAMLQSPEG